MKDFNWYGFFLIILLIIMVLVFILKIYALIKYGTTPLSEVPFWVIWLTKGGNKK